MVKILGELKEGEKGIVAGIKANGEVRQRLIEMGLTIGSDVVMQREAPLGDPIEVQVKGTNLTLRKEIASQIEVEVTGEVEVPLSAVPENRRVVMTRLFAGRGFRGKLMGEVLLPGKQITVLNNKASGPLIIEVDGLKLKIGRGQARKIIVKEA